MVLKPALENSAALPPPASAPCSTASQPPGRRCSQARAAMRSIASRPLGPGTMQRAARLASSGLCKAAIVRCDVGRIGDDEIEVHGADRVVPVTHQEQDIAELEALGVAAGEREACSDVSVAITRAAGRSCAIARATAPLPVPRSSTLACCSAGSTSSANSTSSSVSGRGTSTLRVDFEVQRPEFAPADDIGDRLAALPTRDSFARTVHGSRETAPRRRETSRKLRRLLETGGQQQLGVEPGRGARVTELCDGRFEDSGDGLGRFAHGRAQDINVQSGIHSFPRRFVSSCKSTPACSR